MIRTKIVCTIGPSSREPAMLRRLIAAGMDVARINLSHADHQMHGETIKRIREAAHEGGKPVAILADLQGPKLRVGSLAQNGIDIAAGERVVLTSREVLGERVEGAEASAVIPIRYEHLTKDIRPGGRILIDDGLVELEALEVADPEVICRVITGGHIADSKGVNLPGTRLSVPSITEKDWRDLAFVLDAGIDWVALSFVRSPDEIQRLKAFIADRCQPGEEPRVIAKMEKPEGLDRLDEILAAADGIMVARGDLGIEIPPEQVPLEQKRLIRAANAAGKPVITATQMLDSMLRNPRPTRAEASDVANAILDGSDAIMLSGETAVGQHPIEAVETMVRIAQTVEQAVCSAPWTPPPHVQVSRRDVTDAVSHATCETAEALDAAAIMTATASGRTARAVARYRPHRPILAATPYPTVQRQLMLSWGIIPMLSPYSRRISEMVQTSIAMAVHHGYIEEGSRVVITAGVANTMPGTTNLMTVELARTSSTPVTERADLENDI